MDLQEKQNQLEMIALLRSRRVLGGRIKVAQGIFLFLSVILAMAAFGLSSASEPTRGLIALCGIALALIDAFWLDSWQKNQIKITAKLQEQFDCSLLDIPWNGFIVGSRVSPEDIRTLASKPLTAKKEKELRNWYAFSGTALPAEMTALLCQRSNLWYDGSQRRRYLAGLRVLLGTVTAIFVLCLVETGTSVASAALYAAPLVPFWTWAAKEIVKQISTIETVDHLKEEIERLWDRMPREAAARDGLHLRIRELQDAIYSHRLNSPLVFDWVYALFRTHLDANMGAGVEAWAAELKAAIGEAK